jgi:beta-lactamase regulating signal transducer with metallopeptidase domain
MNFLQIYLYSNIYILFFWMFYRVFLKRSTFFQGQRIFIISSFSLSVLIPFLQPFMSSFIESNQTIINGFNPFNFIYSESEPLKTAEGIGASGPAINRDGIISVLIITGSIITAAHFIYNHFKINRLIKQSPGIKKDNFTLILPQADIVPFIYNDKIFISGSTPLAERDLIIRHESQHYYFGHHYDNYLLQLSQVIFWLNPFFHMLKQELKLIHEYQVDNHLVNTGIDAAYYKLALIRFRAGRQKFAIANGLINCKLKNRIIMMNTIKTKAGKWRFFLFVPALCIVFLALSFTNANNPGDPSASLLSPLAPQQDPIEIKVVTLPEDYKIDNDESIIVLINKASDVLVEESLIPRGKRADAIIKNYEKLREKRFFRNQSPLVKIIVLKDRNTDEKDFKELLDEISTAIYTLQDKSSEQRFGKSFKNLTKEKQAQILEIYPPEIYLAQPKKLNPPPKK